MKKISLSALKAGDEFKVLPNEDLTYVVTRRQTLKSTNLPYVYAKVSGTNVRTRFLALNKDVYISF